MEKLEKYFYINIPSLVILNKNLSSTQKLLYGILVNLSKENGYCFARNKYLANVLNITLRQLDINLKSLKENGLIKVEIVNNNDRKIIPLETKNLMDYEKKIKETNPNVFDYDWINEGGKHE